MYRKISIAVLVIALSYSLISAKNYLSASSASISGAPRAESAAPDFTLFNMQGKPVSLADYRGKVVMLNFWASWCPPCRAEMPSMERLYGRMKGRDFELLAINVEDNGQSAVAAFSKKIPISFPVLLDNAQYVSRLYRVGGIPHTFIINKDGEIVRQVTGARDWNSPAIMEFLTSLTKGE